jgi:hypothetical protein
MSAENSPTGLQAASEGHHPNDEFEEEDDYESSDDEQMRSKMRSVCVRVPTSASAKSTSFTMPPEQPALNLFKSKEKDSGQSQNRDEHQSSSSRSPTPKQKEKKEQHNKKEKKRRARSSSSSSSSKSKSRSPSTKQKRAPPSASARPRAMDLNEKDQQVFKERREQENWIERDVSLEEKKLPEMEPMILTKAGGGWIFKTINNSLSAFTLPNNC